MTPKPFDAANSSIPAVIASNVPSSRINLSSVESVFLNRFVRISITRLYAETGLKIITSDSFLIPTSRWTF